MSRLTAGCAPVGVALVLLAATALAAHPKPGGVYTSTKADVHVSKSGAAVNNAEINCRQAKGGLTLQSMNFGTPVKISRSGSFRYRGQAQFVEFTGSGYKSRMVTATLRGTFVTSKQLKGTIKGGPKACSFARYAATYNPSAH
jgi:hypothetical protein